MKKFIVTTGLMILIIVAHAQKRLTAVNTSKGSVIEHVVSSGESLGLLSDRYKVSLSNLAKANGFKINQGLKIGETIKIPVNGDNLSGLKKRNSIPVYYEVAAGDNLSTIGKRYNVPLKTLKKWNGLKTDVAPKGKELLVGYLAVNGAAKDANTPNEGSKRNNEITGGNRAVVTGNSLNIRRAPDTKEPVVANAKQAEELTVLKTINDEWVAVRTKDGKEGYAASQFLKIDAVKKNNNDNNSGNTSNRKMYVTGNMLNIRKGPSIHEVIVGNVKQNDEVTVLKQINDEWVSVRTGDGIQGYAASQFLGTEQTKEEITATAPKEDLGEMYVTGTSLNIRKNPATTAAIIGNVSQGEAITVIRNINSEWVAVRTKDGKEGFAASQFIGPLSAVPEVAEKPVVQETVREMAVVGTNVNVRKSPSTKDDIIGNLQQYEKVIVTKTINNEWVAIRTSGGLVGYTASRFLGPLSEIEDSKTETALASDNEQQTSSAPITANIPVDKNTTAANEDSKVDETGFFRNAYESQNNIKRKNKSFTSGVFKSSKGWEDARYYLLMDDAKAGQIVKLTNPENNLSVYAKVLGDIKSLNIGNSPSVRISDAAATALRINSDEFKLKVDY